MTDKQLELAKQQLREEMNSKGYGWIDGKHIKPSPELYLRDRELWCIEMINSILAYQGRGMEDAEAVMQSEERRYHNYLAYYVQLLGRDRVVELIQAQIDDIKFVAQNVGTDSEGCTYNSIIWRDE